MAMQAWALYHSLIHISDSGAGMLKILNRLCDWLFPDKRSEAEKEDERRFIQALNQLKTLRTTPGGGMAIDPEEIRDQVLQSREAYRVFVSPCIANMSQNPKAKNPLLAGFQQTVYSQDIVFSSDFSPAYPPIP